MYICVTSLETATELMIRGSANFRYYGYQPNYGLNRRISLDNPVQLRVAEINDVRRSASTQTIDTAK